MKTIAGKLLVPGLILTMLMTSVAFAGKSPGSKVKKKTGAAEKGSRIERHVENLTEKLGLTGEQAQQLLRLMKENQAEIDNYKLKIKELMGKVKKARKNRESGILAVLTPEQQEKYKAMKQKQSEKKQGKRGGRKINRPHSLGKQ